MTATDLIHVASDTPATAQHVDGIRRALEASRTAAAQTVADAWQAYNASDQAIADSGETLADIEQALADARIAHTDAEIEQAVVEQIYLTTLQSAAE